MLKIKIVGVGKTKEEWLETAISEYLKRLKPIAQFDFVYLKDDDALVDYLSTDTPHYITLDEQGKSYSSITFSRFLQQHVDQNGPRLTFVIGGAEGLPASLKAHTPNISLSPMTLTHQMVRLLLIEQIYRALEIQRGSRYHKHTK
jgi:23S rRNA (pseudouridine1915-N3)-methyltransferase